MEYILERAKELLKDNRVRIGLAVFGALVFLSLVTDCGEGSDQVASTTASDTNGQEVHAVSTTVAPTAETTEEPLEVTVDNTVED